ncbi:bifunctional diguanylate cyclase/phosphodiesterase [Cellulomonas sp. APG4]|uniref:putative bifunctional diguanylate cyclase/phosphodiesterase n=1 Tax=Cellulomonas sp. APG4 TaxID=1538656 RepID=UPI00137B680E|nr:bifunctional diguanylate cyclase/phosphodiesterase [Cellulomonas sp. APG4]
MASVAITGVALLLVVLASTRWHLLLDSWALWPAVFLASAALIGEIRPLYVSKGDAPAEAISTSTPFVLALVSLGGIGPALVTQVLASLVDDLRNRRGLQKTAFNTGQYTLSVLAARATYAGLTGLPFFGGPVGVDITHLFPLLAGGVVMVVVNRLLVAVVVSIASSERLTTIIGHEAAFFAATQLVLLSIGGVAANVAASGIAFLALLCAPAVAVYLTTAAGIRHAHQASHDALTGLGNRSLLHQRLRTATARAQAAHREGPGLVLLDLDHFKDVNDTLGHIVGDDLLREVAQRLVSVLGDDTHANRLGGDEFAVVVDGDLVATQTLAHDLLASLEKPIRIGDVELLVRASAGVAIGPEHGTDADELLKNADIALYHAKVERDRISTYSARFDVNTVERLRLLNDLRVAIEQDALGVVYQPQLDLTNGRIVAVEALIRWEHPVHGHVPPDRFIPLAENSGLIAALTAHVLETALGSLAAWRAAGHDLRMSVNVSARHLSDLALPRQVHEALTRHDVPATALVLEVTETALLSDPIRARVVLTALRRLGVAIAVDDYGTGHASLSYLKKLEVDELKVDRSYVSDMGRDEHDFIIVRSTVALARDLGLRVVAEGIEDASTVVALRGLGCDVGQGYHLGRPTSADGIAQLLALPPHDPSREPAPVPELPTVPDGATTPPSGGTPVSATDPSVGV